MINGTKVKLTMTFYQLLFGTTIFSSDNLIHETSLNDNKKKKKTGITRCQVH